MKLIGPKVNGLILIIILMISIPTGIILWNLPITVSAGTDISNDTVNGTWTYLNSPYYINNNITIPFGETLEIEAGVEVICNGTFQIQVSGTLIANGVSWNRVLFYGNDTGVSDYYWRGILFNSTGTGILKNCSIFYANTGLILNNSKNVRIDNCSVFSNYYGIVIVNNSKNNSILDSNITNNLYGCYLNNSNENQLLRTHIKTNIYSGLIFINSSNNTVLSNEIIGNGQGFLLYNGSRYNKIENTVILDNYFDYWNNDLLIQTRSGNNEIKQCKIDWGWINNFEPSDTVFSNSLIKYLIIDNSGFEKIYRSKINGYISFTNSNDIVIKDCNTSEGRFNIYAEDSDDIILKNCTMYEGYSNQPCINIFNCNNFSISDCLINSTQNYGIMANMISNLTIQNSDVFSKYNIGIYAADASNLKIIDTNSSQNYRDGVNIHNSINISIINCIFNSNSRDGINIQSSTNILLQESMLEANSDDGLDASYINNLLVTNCKINENGGNGIESRYSEQFTIIDSNIKDNNNPNFNLAHVILLADTCQISSYKNQNIELNNNANMTLINTQPPSGIYLQHPTAKLYVAWRINIIIKDQIGNFVPNAFVNLTGQNNPPTETKEHVTDESGMVVGVICYEFLKIQDIEIDYNPYVFNAHKSEIGVAREERYIESSKALLLTLDKIDLFPTKISFSYPNDRIPVGNLFNITVEIQNSGSSKFEQIEISLWIENLYNYSPSIYVVNEIPAGGKVLKDIIHYAINDPGTYEVFIKIDIYNKIFELNEDNNIISRTFTVLERPVAVLEANRTEIFEGESIMFYANKSKGPAAIMEYIIDFDDGSDIVILKTTNKIGHTFQDPGKYFVTLQVKDIYGFTSDVDYVPIEVFEIIENKTTEENIPIANFIVYPSEGDVFTTFIFDGSVSIPSKGGSILSWAWSLGDGKTTGEKKFEHTYKDDGEYQVSLKVEDSKGKDSKYFNKTVKVNNIAPTIKLTVSNLTIYVGEPIIINASETTDPDDTLSEPGTRFIWYFGDKDNSSYTESSIQSPDGMFDKQTIFIYMEPGTYTITAVVYDDDNGRSQESINVTVLPKVKKNNGSDRDTGILTENILIISLIILILIIIMCIIFIFLRRRRQRYTKDKDAGSPDAQREQYYVDQYHYSVDNSDLDITVIDSNLGTEPYGTTSDSGTPTTGKSRSKRKSKSKIKTIRSKTNHFQPPAVEVILPDEKVVDWQDGFSIQEHVLSLSEVTVVSDQELLHADMINLNDNGVGDFEKLETFEKSDDEELEEFEPLEPEEEPIAEEPESFESVDGMERLEEKDGIKGIEGIEEVDGFREGDEISGRYDMEDSDESEIKSDFDRDSELLFEFEEDGITKIEFVHVKGTEDNRLRSKTIMATKNEAEKMEKMGEKKRAKKRAKDPLIPIAGIGFVKRSELQRVLGIEENTLDGLRTGKIEYGDISIPEGVPLRLEDSKKDTSLRCRVCFKPIKGKFIKVRRKGLNGTKLGIVGPFCSPGCAAKFGQE